MPKQTPNPSSPKRKYKVSLKLPDKTHTKLADSILEGLEKLPIPTFWKSKSIIAVQFGKLKAEVWMYPVQLRKLFASKTSKLLLERRLAHNLK